VILGVLPSFFIVKETMSKSSTTSAGATPSFTAGGAAIDGPRRSLTMADLRTPPIPHVFLAQFLANVTRGGIFGGGVIVVYAAYGFGLSELEIGGLRSAMSLIGIPVVFGAGYIMDRYGRKFTIVPGLALSGLAMAFLALTDALAVHVSVFIAAFITVHFCVSLISGNMQTLGTDVAPPHARGAFFGVSRQIAQTGSLASPVSFTFLVSTFSYAAAFSFLAATAIAASMVVFFGIPETLRKEPKAAVAVVPDSAGIGTSGTS
jgi:MFS family permease